MEVTLNGSVISMVFINLGLMGLFFVAKSDTKIYHNSAVPASRKR